MASFISPSPEQINELLGHPGFTTDPVVMVNLLKFKDAAHARIYYMDYALPVGNILHAIGAQVVWFGKADQIFIGQDHDWDAVLLVRYPSRQVFLDMIQRPDYQAVSVIRAKTLENTALIVTSALS